MINAVRLRILLVALAGWVNRHQLEVIEYLREENRVLKKHLNGRRLRLTDAQRRRLAVNGHRLDRLIAPELLAPPGADGPVRCRERLGGLLRYYHRVASRLDRVSG